jgi:hypothetical protein
VFDKLVFEVAAFPEKDWTDLKAEYEGPHGYGHPGFDEEAHERKRQERQVRITREFWFDITRFFGQAPVVIGKATQEAEPSQPGRSKLTQKLKRLLGMD